MHARKNDSSILFLQDSDGEDVGDDDAVGKDDTDMNIDIRTNMDVDEGDERVDEGLNVQEVDAYWLQRRISKAFGTIDANTSQKLAEEVFQALQVRCREMRHGLRCVVEFHCCKRNTWHTWDNCSNKVKSVTLWHLTAM